MNLTPEMQPVPPHKENFLHHLLEFYIHLAEEDVPVG
jgi:hypothetical protein